VVFEEVSFGATAIAKPVFDAQKDAFLQASDHAEDVSTHVHQHATIQDITQNESVTAFADVSRGNQSQNAGFQQSASDLDMDVVTPKRLIGFATPAELSSGLVDIFA
jgi:hypothetical protein